tara:strand:+ start:61835 stop:62350 length:516 start_codon:yes stop_codon:yes gene_type:complete
MSKKALKNYLSTLPKKELEIQLLDLYNRFPAVKEYYDFIFNPKEEKRIQEAKVKISNEFFPIRRKKPRARRSLAQKYIKHFTVLGVNPFLIADLMLYSIEICQSFSEEKNVNDVFYRSMLRSYQQVIHYVVYHQFIADYGLRIEKIYTIATAQKWSYLEDFSVALAEIKEA